MLRKRKNRRYNEEANEDEELDGERKFNIQDQIKCERFDLTNRDKHLLEIEGHQLTLGHFQRFGFEKPILVTKPDGLKLTVPTSSKFAVRDVRNAVGHQRIIDVMDVKTQKNIEMSMKDWCKYYESKHRDRLLNVISLEFSHTKLDELVDSPMIVKLLDWVDLVWPKFLKQAQTESTNSIDKMKYPKVQKYCLMSVKGSYTDFHIDFGGTSVWYHILKGKKIFWMVPPTELNLQTFEEWTLSGMQQDVFFGDTVEECFRVELCAGNTFFIPSGWIHAVYTLEDSLVFGGNFLHSFGIENQLKVSKIEDSTKVPVKFRYPFYTEILWYVVQHYVYCLTGKDHLHRPKPEVPKKKALREADEDDEDTEEAENSSSTESEEVEEKCDKPTANKKRKTVAAETPAKRSRGRPPAKGSSAAATKRSKKRPPSESENSDDDSSATEIESDNEEPTKAANKPTTCRMTKNSLLRLQYELDQKEQAEVKHALTSPTKSTTKLESGKNTSSIKKEHPVTSDTKPNLHGELTPTAPNSLNDSKLNGWSALTTTTTGAPTNCWSGVEKESKDPPRVHLTKYELNGLKALVKHLSKLSGAKKNLPALIRNSRHLLDDCKKMIAEHENDSPELAVTGKAITPELLSTKRADINEMIKQFFKEPTNGSDELSSPSSHASLHKSSKLHLPSALDALAARTEDKSKLLADDHFKNTSPNKSSPHKETKSLSPSSFADLIAATSTEKKAFDVSGADVTSALFGTKDLTGAKQSKSPNKASKSTKQDESTHSEADRDSSMSIRDPIAQLTASTQPIGSASSSATKETQKAPSTSAQHHQPQQQQQQTNSPELPKNPVQQKRFINPAFRPLSKEKLIFASAPYVSPVHEQARSSNLYPWQSPAVPQQPPLSQQQSTPSQQTNTASSSDSGHKSDDTQQPYNPNQTQPNSYNPSAKQPKIDGNSSSTSPDLMERSKSDSLTKQADVKSNNGSSNEASHQQNASKAVPPKIVDREKQNTVSDSRGSSPSKTPPSIPKMTIKLDAAVPTSFIKIDGDKTEKLSNDSSASSSNVCESEQSKKKPAKPRGPPKKSKEARQAIGTYPDTANLTTRVLPFPQHQQQLPQSNQQPQAAHMASTPNQALPVPISFVRLANPQTGLMNNAQIQMTMANNSKIAASAPTTSTAPTPKSKSKRTKKQKESDKPVATTGSGAIQNAAPISGIGYKFAPQQSVICGLVTQPSNSAPSGNGSKGSPQQQYLISRPLMINSMPTMSAAQFQQMARPQMPLMAAPPGSLAGLSLPGGLHPGARIVWAHQQRPTMATGLPVTNTLGATTSSHSLSTAKSATAANGMSLMTPMNSIRPTQTSPQNMTNSTSSSADNAALLSLATTALSTAPMTSSPALSQVGVRTPITQAIMVSSASNQPIAFAPGQQYFPLMQRMPTIATHFLPTTTTTATSSGTSLRPGPSPRASSQQVVYARLPNQNQQARFLITQPGFMTQRLGSPQFAVANQPSPRLAFPAYLPPPATDTTKAMKTKKLKTS